MLCVCMCALMLEPIEPRPNGWNCGIQWVEMDQKEKENSKK